MSRDSSPKRGDDSKCKQCHIKLEKGKEFCITAAFACHACKVALDGATLLQEPFKKKWSDCNPLGQPIFVGLLGKLYVWCGKKSSSDPSVVTNLETLLGKEVVASHKAHLFALYDWAREEMASYRFGPIDFSQVRLERAFATQPQVIDFWLTLCVAFDLGNYIDDAKGAGLKVVK